MRPVQFCTALLIVIALVLFSPQGLADHDLHVNAAPATDGRAVLSVVTLNLARETDCSRILSEWRAHPSVRSSDVLLLQEVIHWAGEKPSVAQLLAKELGYYVVSEPNTPKLDTDGLAILSRYPLTDISVRPLPGFDLGFRSRKRIMLAANVQTPQGPVRVYNTHLDTRINPAARIAQLAPVIADAAEWQGPRLIGGDLNTNYFRWARNMMPLPFAFAGKSVKKAMAEKGFTTPLVNAGPTFDHFGFQLDWVYARDMDPVGAAVQPLEFSDHHAVVVKLAFEPAR